MFTDIKLLHKDAKVPTRAHDDDFAYDCYAVSCEEIAPNVFKYGLGFALQSPSYERIIEGVGFTIRPRSSIWKTGMVLSNSIGTVDAGYTGEISVVFYHLFTDLPKYEVGDRVCQIHLDRAERILFNEVEELADTERGDGGYGSTGK